MSPPWATTSSRFWVVWAAAGPVSPAGRAAAAPAMAAPLRSSRRVTVMLRSSLPICGIERVI